MIVVVDYQTGNLRSVLNAIKRVGYDAVVSSDLDTIRSAEKVILPGVGDASVAMGKLKERNLDTLIKTLTQPVLGICVGMQVMCNYSEEGSVECMGIFNTSVRHLRNFPEQQSKIKIPHMGWNKIQCVSDPLFNEIEQDDYIYYVHSFAAEICEHTIATTNYGVSFSAALRNNNFVATQFHPEKSGSVGEKILKNFLEL